MVESVDLVIVRWVDITETCDWSTEVVNPEFESVGWLISKPKAKFVQVATTVDSDGKFSSILSIPRGAVLSQTKTTHEEEKTPPFQY